MQKGGKARSLGALFRPKEEDKQKVKGAMSAIIFKTNDPTKAETKVMVAIKEVNENELPENGTTPSVCLHVSSVHSISILFTFRTSSACLHVSSIRPISLSELLLYVYM